jgi:hypothetical protein
MEAALNMDDDDRIDPGPGAIGLFDASDEEGTTEWAGVSWNTGYRLVFTTFTPNEIAYCDPDTFFEDLIAWLDSSE